MQQKKNRSDYGLYEEKYLTKKNPFIGIRKNGPLEHEIRAKGIHH